MKKKSFIPTPSLRWLVLGAYLVAPMAMSAGGEQRPGNSKISFPDLAGYKTLTGDFHIHTVFSDGRVWPSIRVEEALKEGLDAIAITDHLEYSPHIADIPNPDRNRSHAIAELAVKGRDVMVVRGAEITRSMPPGHMNAIFLEDVNRLMPDVPPAYIPQLGRPPASPAAEKRHIESAMTVLREAAKQGAFVIWNHPGWLRHFSDGVARLTEVHELMLKENLFQGVEIVNGYNGFSEEALQIALDHNLTLIGNSDIHNPVDLQYDNPWRPDLSDGGHRPVTLIFAREKTQLALKEALFERRTVVWWENTLIGREQWLAPLLEACLRAVSGGYLPDPANADRLEETSVLNIDLINSSDADFIVRNLTAYSMTSHANVFVVPPHRSTRIQLRTLERLTTAVLSFEILNSFTAPRTHPVMTFTVETGVN